MRYLSLFSGIEAASVAWEQLGWTPVGFAEIEAFPAAVLAHRFPDVPNFGDVTKFGEWFDDCLCIAGTIHQSGDSSPATGNGLESGRVFHAGRDREGTRGSDHLCERCGGLKNGTIDIVVGGSPCQSYSVAGLRKGLEDPRGQLTFTYAHILARYRPRYFVWENVPGVLSSAGGRDFADFLGLLTGTHIELPKNKFKNSGIVEGIDSAYGIAWRVLDAQYVRSGLHVRAVPQRRRRVFVVGCLQSLGDSGGWKRAAEILSVATGRARHFTPRRETGKGVAGKVKGGVGERGCPDPSDGNGGGLVAVRESGHGSWMETEAAGTLDASMGMSGHANRPAVIAYENHPGDSRITELKDGIAPTVSARWGTGGNNVPLVQRGSHWDSGGNPHPTLNQSTASSGGLGYSDQELFNQRGSGLVEDVSPTVTAKGSGGPAGDETQNLVAEIAGTLTRASNAGGTVTHQDAVSGQLVVEQTAYRMDALASNSMKSSNPHSGFGEAEAAKTLDTVSTKDHPTLNQGGNIIVTAIRTANTNANGHGIAEEVAHTLDQAQGQAIAIQGNLIGRNEGGPQGIGVSDDGSMYTLTKTDVHAVATADAFAGRMRQGKEGGGKGALVYDNHTGTLATGNDRTLFTPQMAVRRLTPTECERLQGFPDGWTRIPWKGKPPEQCPDGPRYKAIGNSMATNVMHWIGRRIQLIEEAE